MAQAAVLRAQNRAANKGSDPRVATCRGKLQSRRSKLNQEINRELRLRAGAENLFRATTNRKMKETVALELSFVNSNLQLLKEQLAELNSSVEVYQSESPDPVMPMIPLGLKETKEIDFREPFKDFILEHYSEDGAKYDEAITEFMELRQGMRTPQRDSSGISLLFRYYNQLYFVERRFFPPDRSLGIYFEWYDSLTGVPSCQRTVAFEKASVLFNLAALYTQAAARRERSRPKPLDQAVDSFLRAAGTLDYLLDNFANAPSMDLSPPMLGVLKHLMLAQARECLFEKLELQSADKKSADMFFDLGQEAAKIVEVYEEAERSMSQVNDYLPYSWSALCGVKREYYGALASHRTALGLLASSRPGGAGGTAPPPPPRAGKMLAALADAPLILDGGLSDKLRLLASAHLRSALNHHEEAARLQRMCRELRSKRCLSQVLTKTAKDSHDAYSRLQHDSQQLAELLDPLPLPGRSQLVLSLTLPDFGQERVEDLFRGLGPLAVFSAKLHWSAPRSVRLQQGSPPPPPPPQQQQQGHEGRSRRLREEEGGGRGRRGSPSPSPPPPSAPASPSSPFGFTVSTDCPVVVTSVQSNSLAHYGGIKEGDFIVAIGDSDVKWSSHEEVVRLIRESHEVLNLKVATPMTKNYLKSSRSSSKASKKDASCKAVPGQQQGQSGSSNSTLQKKLSWNPFKRNREREAALGIVSR